jgi:hypothetical protein
MNEKDLMMAHKEKWFGGWGCQAAARPPPKRNLKNTDFLVII